VPVQVGGERGDHWADAVAHLAAASGALEDGGHDIRADVQALVLEIGKHLSVGEVVAEQAVDGFRADLSDPG